MKVKKNIAISIHCEQTEFFILFFQSHRVTAGSSFQDPQILKLRAPIKGLVWEAGGVCIFTSASSLVVVTFKKLGYRVY